MTLRVPGSKDLGLEYVEFRVYGLGFRVLGLDYGLGFSWGLIQA